MKFGSLMIVNNHETVVQLNVVGHKWSKGLACDYKVMGSNPILKLDRNGF